MDFLPLLVPLSGRSVLIVGGGELALRKLRVLSRLTCDLVVIAPEVHKDLEGAARIERRAFRPEDVDGHALVFAATEDEALAAAVSAAAKARGVPVNVPDQPALCSFTMPAIVDRDPIVVAIGSGGASPLLVRTLRARIEATLEPGLGRFARFLQQFRGAVKATRSDPVARRRFWEGAVDGPVSQRFLAGDESGAREAFLHALNRSEEGSAEGSVALVGAGPGDPDLLTLKALRLLQNADVIVHDKLVDERILDYGRRDARRINVGKSKSRHSWAQADIQELLLREAQAGNRVVRLKAGDPFVFGRGGEELECLREAGIPVEAVPGVTAATGCGAATTIPLTHRNLADGVSFVTGHDTKGIPDLDWDLLAKLRHTLVIYMGLSTAPVIARRLIEAGKDSGTPVAMIENGTRPEQRVAIGTLAELPELAARHGIAGPALIVVGEVVRLADKNVLAAAAQRLAAG